MKQDYSLTFFIRDFFFIQIALQIIVKIWSDVSVSCTKSILRAVKCCHGWWKRFNHSRLHSRLLSNSRECFLTSTVTILTLVDIDMCRHAGRLGYAKMMLLLGFRFPCTLYVSIFNLELTTTACIENDFGGNLYLLRLVKGGMQIKFPTLFVLSTQHSTLSKYVMTLCWPMCWSCSLPSDLLLGSAHFRAHFLGC